MATITDLVPARGKRGLVRVAIDGVDAGLIRAADAVSLGLQRGARVDANVVDRIEALSGQSEALQIANRFIAFRPRSVAEVRQRLRRGGIGEQVAESVLQALLEDGVLDDRRFADAWVENRTALSPRSPRLIQMELRRKGIDRETVDESLESSTGTDELALAVDAGRRRLRRLSQLDRRTFDTTMGSFLARRGFSADAMRAALETLWSERSGDERSL
jgi:regulatory protein